MPENINKKRNFYRRRRPNPVNRWTDVQTEALLNGVIDEMKNKPSKFEAILPNSSPLPRLWISFEACQGLNYTKFLTLHIDLPNANNTRNITLSQAYQALPALGPTAQKFYNKIIQQAKSLQHLNWFLLKNKMRNLKTTYKAVLAWKDEKSQLAFPSETEKAILERNCPFWSWLHLIFHEYNPKSNNNNTNNESPPAKQKITISTDIFQTNDQGSQLKIKKMKHSLQPENVVITECESLNTVPPRKSNRITFNNNKSRLVSEVTLNNLPNIENSSPEKIKIDLIQPDSLQHCKHLTNDIQTNDNFEVITIEESINKNNIQDPDSITHLNSVTSPMEAISHNLELSLKNLEKEKNILDQNPIKFEPQISFELKKLILNQQLEIRKLELQKEERIEMAKMRLEIESQERVKKFELQLMQQIETNHKKNTK